MLWVYNIGSTALIQISSVSFPAIPTTLTNSLCAFYNFDGNALDVSGNGKDLSGTYNAVTGKVGLSAANFTTFGTCGSGPGLYRAENLWDSSLGDSRSNSTVSFWYYPTQNITYTSGCSYTIFGNVFGKMGDNIGYQTNKQNILYFAVGSVVVEDPSPMVVGNWYHFVKVHDAVSKTLSLYRNGVLVAFTSYSSISFSSNDWVGYAVNGSGGGYSPPIEYGVPCRFDAVGLWNRVLTPTEISALYNNGNGIQSPFTITPTNWQTFTTSTFNGITVNQIHYGDGTFFMGNFNNSNVAVYSDDGTTWTSVTLPRSQYWQGGDYGNGTYVLVGGDNNAGLSNRGAYSTNKGRSWTEMTLPVAGAWPGVAYGNGIFVAVCGATTLGVAGSNVAAYSTNGINWTQASGFPIGSRNWVQVIFGGGKFVAIAGGYASQDTNSIAYSTDGINWSIATLPVTTNWANIAYGGGIYVAVGYNNSNVAYSYDGITWLPGSNTNTANWNSVAYGSGKFIAVPYGTNTNYLQSTDGINWTAAALPTGVRWQGVAFGNGRFVAIPFGGSTAAFTL